MPVLDALLRRPERPRHRSRTVCSATVLARAVASTGRRSQGPDCVRWVQPTERTRVGKQANGWNSIQWNDECAYRMYSTAQHIIIPVR